MTCKANREDREQPLVPSLSERVGETPFGRLINACADEGHERHVGYPCSKCIIRALTAVAQERAEPLSSQPIEDAMDDLVGVGADYGMSCSAEETADLRREEERARRIVRRAFAAALREGGKG